MTLARMMPNRLKNAKAVECFLKEKCQANAEVVKVVLLSPCVRLFDIVHYIMFQF